MSIIEHIKEISYILTNGVTEPVRAKLNDNTEVIVKLFNNCQGNLTLVNEWVSYNLALLLDLPVIQSGICMCDSDTTINNNSASTENFGPCFYSSYLLKSTPLKLGIVRLLENINDFYKLVLFDHIIYNHDRNIFNLLATYNKGNIRFKLIDHSHVFKNETIWNAACFSQGIRDFDVTDTYILTSNSALYSMFYQSMDFEKENLYLHILAFQDNITEDKLRAILNSVPVEWALPNSDSDALIEYILYRTQNLEVICNTICNYLDNR